MIEIIDYNSKQMEKVFARTQLNDTKLIASVEAIVDDVRNRGDEALFEYALKFDATALTQENIMVSEEEISKAYNDVDPALIESLRRAKTNILDYHKRQKAKFCNEFFASGATKQSTLGWIYRPLSRVGLYVPGGKASYPSSVLMTVLPAVAAGVEEVVVVTPNIKNPAILVACHECGVKRIYKVGGAQAIGALAFGTQSIPKVDLIAGPGNVFVTLAKKYVYGQVAIDMIAGPSEILVIADETSRADYVASDLLSQAEHDEQAASILVTTSRKLAKEVALEVERQTQLLDRKEIIEKSLMANSAIIVVDNIQQAIEVSDTIAPEHLELCIKNAKEVAMKLKNCGAIFVGNYSPEPLGDYFAGPSHVLPTSGSARYSSVLSVDTFMKKISYIDYHKDDLLAVGEDIVRVATSEGFSAHANTISIRKG